MSIPHVRVLDWTRESSMDDGNLQIVIQKQFAMGTGRTDERGDASKPINVVEAAHCIR
jgi:hypothetical protein